MDRLKKLCEGNGLTKFEGNGFVSYQDKPINEGGIRIEICDNIASIWCAQAKISILACGEIDCVTWFLRAKQCEKQHMTWPDLIKANGFVTL